MVKGHPRGALFLSQYRVGKEGKKSMDETGHQALLRPATPVLTAVLAEFKQNFLRD